MKKQAILFQNGSIGDFLMFVWLAEQLHESGEFEKVTIIVPRGASFLAGFLGRYPYIELVQISRSQPFGALRLWRQTRAQKTSVVAIIHPTPGRIPLFVKLFAWMFARLSGQSGASGSALIGFQDAGMFCKTLYTKVLVYNTHQLYSDTVRDIARAVGTTPSLGPPRLAHAPTPRVFKKYSVEEKNYVVFHPGASAKKRAFSTEDAVVLCGFLLEQFPALKVVLSGGPDEKEWLENIKKEFAKTVYSERIVLAVGAPAKDICTLVAGAKLFVGPDTGVTHLACFLGTKTLVVAHHGTANWLPFYAPNATVLYRFAEDADAHEGKVYFDAHVGDRLKPFGEVPMADIQTAVTKLG